MAGTESTEAADLEAGYSDSPTATPEVTPTPEPATSEAVDKTVPTETPAPTPAPFDAQAEFRKLHDTMQGRIGDLNRQLQEALKAKEEAAKPTPSPAPRFKRVTEAYSELAGQLVPDIEEALSELSGKAADPKQLQELIDAKLHAEREAERDAQFKARFAELSEIHPDWEKDLWAGNGVRTADYEAWSQTMTPEALAKFENSNSVVYADRKLTEFYAWKKAKAAQASTPEPTQPPRTVSTRQKRLEAAVTPRGTGGHATGGSTELDEMEAGYSG